MHKQLISKLSIDGLTIEIGRFKSIDEKLEKIVNEENDLLKGFVDLQNKINELDSGVISEERT